VIDVTPCVAPGVVAGEEEPEQLHRGGVPADAHDSGDAVADPRVGRGEQGRPRAHAHADHGQRTRAAGGQGGDGCHHGLDVVGS
jgi:hypothetical protein